MRFVVIGDVPGYARDVESQVANQMWNEELVKRAKRWLGHGSSARQTQERYRAAGNCHAQSLLRQ